MSLGDLGLDGRLLALLGAGTLAAAGLGYVAAAALDTGGVTRVAAIAAPPPTVSPEAQDDAPLTLPAVAAPASAPRQAPPPPAAPSPDPAIPAPAQAPAPPPLAPVRPTTSATTPPPEPEQPEQPQPPRSDDSQSVPFRPAPAGNPLAQFTVAAADFPGQEAAARRQLAEADSRAGATAATRSDVAYVLELDRRFAATRFPGRRAAVSRMLRLNAWWYARRGAPGGRVLVRDPEGLIYSYSAGHGFALNPVGTAGRWQRLNEGFSAAQLADALLQVGVADDRGGRRTTTWEYYDVPGPPRAIRPGASGMAQARIARLMASALQDTGDQRYLTASADALASLAVDVGAGGVRSLVAEPGRTDTAPWYVERAYPGEAAWTGGALNGFMVAIVELRAAERALRSSGAAAAGPVADEARRLADEGSASLERFLPLHDSGRWSYYGLLSPGHPWRSYLANATYHCYHVSLLRTLAELYPASGFASTADRWSGYATRVGVTCPGEAPAG